MSVSCSCTCHGVWMLKSTCRQQHLVPDPCPYHPCISRHQPVPVRVHRPLPMGGCPSKVPKTDIPRGGSKVNPGSPLGQPWVPDFFRASVCPRRKLGYGRSRKLFGKTWIPVQTEPASTGPRTKLVNRGSPRPVFVFACAGQPDQIVNL